MNLITLIIPTTNLQYKYNNNQIDKNFDIVIAYDASRSGPGETRQTALNDISTRFVAFMDDDDSLSPNFMFIANKIIKDNPDTELIIGNIERSFITGEVQYPLDSNMTWLHGKIYSVDFLRKNNIEFPKGIKYNEDIYFNTLVTEKVNYDKVVKVDCCMYYYNSCNTSMTHLTVTDNSKRELCANDTIKVYNMICDITNNNEVLLKRLKFLYEMYNEAIIFKLHIDYDLLNETAKKILSKVTITNEFYASFTQFIKLLSPGNYNKELYKTIIDIDDWIGGIYANKT